MKSVVEKKEMCVLYCVHFCHLHYIFWANEVKESKHGIIIVLCIHFVTSKYVKSLCLFHVSPWACMNASFNLCDKPFNIILCSFRKSFVFLFSLTGNNLFATEAFTIFSVFTAMQFTVGTLPYAIRCLAEANVSCQKLQVILL